MGQCNTPSRIVEVLDGQAGSTRNVRRASAGALAMWASGSSISEIARAIGHPAGLDLHGGQADRWLRAPATEAPSGDADAVGSGGDLAAASRAVTRCVRSRVRSGVHRRRSAERSAETEAGMEVPGGRCGRPRLASSEAPKAVPVGGQSRAACVCRGSTARGLVAGDSDGTTRRACARWEPTAGHPRPSRLLRGGARSSARGPAPSSGRRRPPAARPQASVSPSR